MGGADGSFGYTSTSGTPARLYLLSSAAIRGSLSVKSPINATALIFLSFARVLGISMLVRLFARQFRHVLAVKSTSTGRPRARACATASGLQGCQSIPSGPSLSD